MGRSADSKKVQRLVRFGGGEPAWLDCAQRKLGTGPQRPQLTGLAPGHGVTAYLMGGDGVPTTERSAAEVAPAGREAVARGRRGTT